MRTALLVMTALIVFRTILKATAKSARRALGKQPRRLRNDIRRAMGPSICYVFGAGASFDCAGPDFLGEFGIPLTANLLEPYPWGLDAELDTLQREGLLDSDLSVAFGPRIETTLATLRNVTA